MSESANPVAETPAPRKSNKSTYIIIFLCIIIIIQGVKIYLDRGEQQQLIADKTSTEKDFNETRERLKEISA
jgi:hypothetical protein